MCVCLCVCVFFLPLAKPASLEVGLTARDSGFQALGFAILGFGSLSDPIGARM